jgi:hypothetical protein
VAPGTSRTSAERLPAAISLERGDVGAVLGSTMIVATWNLENLFRPGSVFGPLTDQTYQAKLAALAAVLTDIAPDALAVQELGEPEPGQDLVDTVGGRLPSQASPTAEASG